MKIIAWILFISWSLFSLGWFLQIETIKFYHIVLLLIVLLTATLGIVLVIQRKKWIKYFEKDLNSVDEYFKKRNFKNIGMWIALASGLELYLELILIRLHTSYFQIFGYFKNISLIACFLGLGIGYALGLKKKCACDKSHDMHDNYL